MATKKGVKETQVKLTTEELKEQVLALIPGRGGIVGIERMILDSLPMEDIKADPGEVLSAIASLLKEGKVKIETYAGGEQRLHHLGICLP